MCRQKTVPTAENPSAKLRPETSGPCQIFRARPHRVIVDIDGLYNDDAVDQVKLAQVTHKTKLKAHMNRLASIGP